MNLQLRLTPEAEAKLRQQAVAAGKDLDTFVLEAIERTLLVNAATTPASNNNTDSDPFLGLLSDEPELADFISDSAMQARENRPLRTRGE